MWKYGDTEKIKPFHVSLQPGVKYFDVGKITLKFNSCVVIQK